MRIRPRWDEGQWYLGSLLYEKGECKEARTAFAQLLRLHPQHAGAMALAGLCSFQLGAHEEALRQLLRSRQLNIQKTPDIATVVRYHTGMLLTRFSEFEAGNQVLTELASEQIESPQVIEAFGVNLLRMPLLPAEVPGDARDRVQLAGRVGFAIAARQASRADVLVNELVSRYGSTPNVQYVSGVYWLAQDPARAMAAFRREIEMSPSHVPARLQLAFELVKQGDAEAARPHAAQAVELAPENFSAHLALGQVHLGLGNVTEAIVAFETAVRVAPESPQTHFMLALAYGRAGRHADAQRERQTFSKLSATNPAGAR